MENFLKVILCSLALLIAPNAQAAQSDIHYMGFNSFSADNPEAERMFDEYLGKLQPILTRYKMTVEAYTVVHGGKESLKANVVTFGTAVDQASFQAFFQDEEFQKIFPILLGALDDHQVIFTAGPFAPNIALKSQNVLLEINWLIDNDPNAIDKYNHLTSGMSSIFEQYGVRAIGQEKGVYSNRGLANEITDTVSPGLVELWSIRHAHKFFEDPLLVETSTQQKALLTRKENFWIKPRKIP